MQDERKSHWKQVCHNKSPLEVSWYQPAPTLSLGLVPASRADRSAPLTGVGGGASTLGDNLLVCGFTAISVLDVSARALAFARQRLGDRAQQVQWIESDITQFEPDDIYMVWHDRAVFHFLTDASDRLRYRQRLEHVLAPNGQIIIGTFAPGGPERCSDLPVLQYDAAHLHGRIRCCLRVAGNPRRNPSHSLRQRPAVQFFPSCASHLKAVPL